MAEQGSGALVIRQAEREDIAAIVGLLAQDEVAGGREQCVHPLPQAYYDAFEDIARSSDNTLVVAEIEGAIVGTLQLTLIPNISRQGGKRALVEAVFVDGRYQGLGIGRKLMQWVIDTAQEAGCSMVQLTTNKQRQAAHRFYESLGFVGSHTGMKLVLEQGEHC